MSTDSLAQVPPTHTPDDRKITKATVDVLMQPDDQFLLTQRPKGKPYADYWESPDDKLEVGESVEVALTHELKGGLDTTLCTCALQHTIEHDYAHVYVRLHLYRVMTWDGTLRTLEGQDFA